MKKIFSRIEELYVYVFGPNFGPKKTTQQTLNELVQELNKKGCIKSNLNQGAKLPVESLKSVLKNTTKKKRKTKKDKK